MEEMLFVIGSARMRIVPDQFFPTTKTNLRKLVKFILQAEFPKDTEYLEQINTYLKDRIQYLKDRRNFYAGHYETFPDADLIDKYYIDRQYLAVDATVNKIEDILKKLKINLEYLETL